MRRTRCRTECGALDRDLLAALRTAQDAVMRLPQWMTLVNKHATNRLQLVWAPYLVPWSVVVHRGRHSGLTYRTPLWAFRRGDTLVIGLMYGETDWCRNVLAAGGGELLRRGRSWTLINPRIVTAAQSTDLPPGTRWAARAWGIALVADLLPAT